MRLTRDGLESVDLEPLRRFAANQEEFFGSKQHYRLLAHLARLTPLEKVIIDIGTHQGDSALALSLGSNVVHTFDIEDRVGDRNLPDNIHRHLENLFDPATRANWRDVLLASRIICIDIDPHEGTRELELVKWLASNRYQGIIVLDDIWFFPKMREIWEQIPYLFKTDASALGHWAGTGLVSFKECIEVDAIIDQSVVVVSAFVPIPVKHLNSAQYHELGRKLMNATAPRVFSCFEHALDRCWLYNEPGLPWIPAAPVPSDRYETPEDNVKSHIVQHNRTTWALQAANGNPEARVIVWLDYGVLKQGGWNGNQLEAEHVREFLDRVAAYPFEKSMPFPGIEEQKPIDHYGNNWRFCGSTHIWPVKWLPTIDRVYKEALRDFIVTHRRVPLDLAIWPEVEKRCSVLGPDHVPFLQYRAEYDSSQLLGFPEKE